MALSTPRLVLLVFGVLLVVCGISVGVSEAFKHDRTTTATIERHIERVVVRAGTGKVHLEGTESQRVMSISGGSAARARATPTRCRSPPESCEGR